MHVLLSLLLLLIHIDKSHRARDISGKRQITHPQKTKKQSFANMCTFVH